MENNLIDKLIEQQETIKGMQENEESAIKIMKMYEDYKLRVDKVIKDLEKIKEINNKHTIKKNILIDVDIDHIDYWIKILKGSE